MSCDARVDEKKGWNMKQYMMCVKRMNLIEDEGMGVGRIWDGKIRSAGGGKFLYECV